MKKILVIEDDQIVLNNILKLLIAEGFNAFGAEDGNCGIELAHSLLPDLVLCDIMMPKIDGYNVLNSLRSHPVTVRIPFIFLSAKADRTDVRQGMEMGADDYLTKPFTRAELLGAIAARLERQAAILANNEIPSPSNSKLLNHWRNQLEDGLARGEFQLYYQPQVDLQTFQIIGAEVLLRWQHPNWGLVPPSQFIPLAEETGLIIPIGEWVLQTACMQMKRWQLAGCLPLRVAVNLSGRQFSQPCLNSRIINILKLTGLEAKYLELELTESTIVKDPKAAVQIMEGLKQLGVQISIDDFGTGYSSLNYLKKFPFNTLKIDRSFVNDITQDSINAAITIAIIQMAQSLNLRVIAEGVETEAERNFLSKHCCHAMQGYLFSPPLTVNEFESLLYTDKTLSVK